jgi:glycine oxidase
VTTYDVAIIGGGIIGASIAFELAPKKVRVIVLDRREPGQEASWAAAGMLSPAPHSPRDLPLVSFARESLRLYPQFVTAIEEASGKPAAHAREGALEIFMSADAEGESENRARGLRRLGFSAESISADAVRQMDPAISPSACSAVRLPEEETVEPRALMDALLTSLHNCGVEVRASCEASGLLIERDRCTGVIAGGEKILAEHVVVAAGCFSAEVADQASLSHLAPTRPVRGQMLALRPKNSAPQLRHVVRSEQGYLVPRKDGTIVVGSTLEEAGFEKQVTAAGLHKMLNGAIEMCPALGAADVIETWAGLRPGSPDDLPILGPVDIAGLWMATGHYRNGILLAPATANLMRDWILGVKPALNASGFSPMRFGQRQIRSQTAI